MTRLESSELLERLQESLGTAYLKVADGWLVKLLKRCHVSPPVSGRESRVLLLAVSLAPLR